MHQSPWVLATLVGLWAVLGTGQVVQAADKKPIPVKEIDSRGPSGGTYEGIVGKIDADGVIVVEIKPSGETIEHHLVPVDKLRKGELLDGVWGMCAYRWKDMKPGDTVQLRGLEDKADGVLYCLEICIRRRPKEKLPESQLPKDDHRYAADRIFNDVDNGMDVPDEELLKVFPPKPKKEDEFGRVTPAFPGGLWGEYKEKLDAIRAKKKEKELKATPPEQK